MKDIHNADNNQTIIKIIPKTKLRKKNQTEINKTKENYQNRKEKQRIIITSNFRVVQSTKSEINV